MTRSLNGGFPALLILALLVAWPGAAWGLTPEEVITRLQQQYDRTGAFQAHFRQESKLPGESGAEAAEGQVYFQKPTRMRWLYETPAEQKKEVVTDGVKVWIYLPQEHLVTIYALKAVLRSDLVMRFFSGIGQISKEFTLAWKRPPEKGGAFIIDLIPKTPQPELTRLTLTINPQTYLVERLEFSNQAKEEIRYAFSRMTLDVKLKPGFFTFAPPPGVQVVEQ